ncbi:MAG: YdbH domain-containing protein [Sphingobium sp.]|jgi:translocation and assembly module TamB|nr:YdbH domain-containing protein [Sphingobium sp.]MCI1270502.1 YdbH domain-containing protein [Sphingobium sp.]MCI1756486.1 YdbH domain-containing protein [Sphingobium sp.]MCI2051814.1 YdbH domain-containing protein [Sphingobium sp.]
MRLLSSSKSRIAALLILLGCTMFALVWLQRDRIADHYVQRSLAAKHVRASYRITQVALRTQRIENLVLGDPARPDLVAQSVEVDIGYGLGLPYVANVRVRGARLRGRLDAAGLHLGELDKFRDPGSTAPFHLPDIDLTLDDAGARIETPLGPVGLTVSGSGNLQSGFAGKIAALMRDVSTNGCATPRLTAYLDVAMRDGAPRLSGPVRASALGCGGARNNAVTLAEVALKTDVVLSSALDGWKGTVGGEARAIGGSGVLASRPRLAIRFEGQAQQMALDGTLEADAVTASALNLAGLRASARSAASTPLGPLLSQLAEGVGALQRNNQLHAAFALDRQRSGTHLAVTALELKGEKQSRIALGRGGRIELSLPDMRWTMQGGLVSSGGGLPDMALRLNPARNGGVAGQMFVKPYAARGSRLELEPVRFTAGRDGATHIVTRLRLDGPMPDGVLRGLEIPVTAHWGPRGLAVNTACAPVRVSALKVGAVALGDARLTACPLDGGMITLREGRMGGGIALGATQLVGRMGESPMRLSARSARYRMSAGFALEDVDVRMGATDAPMLLRAGRLEGRALAEGVGGSASGIEAKIGTVPLLVREGAARWGFAKGALVLNGRILVLDDANPDRFNPLESNDFRLTLANSWIDANGTVRLPGKDRTIASVTIRHSLGDGTGNADFRMDGLRFDRALQPDEITHIALGVIANVDGRLDGSGEIRWTREGVTSTGSFSTNGMNLAAAFGPVTGLSTTVRFTDLLGLVTAPHQEMRLPLVNAGVEVRDGVVHYALLPGQRVAIEDGTWPFAGGRLSMLPTVMDMSAEKPRNLSFRIVGLDAGQFIQLMELENISATGTFDGLLPMVFDAEGGRIRGGILTARQQGTPPLVLDHVEGVEIPCDRARQGGRLSYVGQVSNENLGFMGKLAFDALKDLQYKCLTILMDGALDGEVVTQVTFNGVNRGALSNVPKPIAQQFIGLPFIFNITIAAPFRGLINTARSFTDPSLLIRQHLGDGYEAVKRKPLAVQPNESQTMPSGSQK